MINFITFTIQGIILIIFGLIIGDMLNFIYKIFKYYKIIKPGDIYNYYELPNKKIKVKIIEKKLGRILFQYIYPDGSKGMLDISIIPLFYLSSDFSEY